MSTGAGNVRELGNDLTSILNSFASMLEGVYFVDEDLADSLAAKFSDRLRTEVRAVYADMAKDIADALAKPPVRKRRRRKKVEDSPIEEMADMAVGVEELDANPGSLLQQVQDEASVQTAIDGTLASETVTSRATQRGGGPTTKWDTDNPTMRPMRDG